MLFWGQNRSLIIIKRLALVVLVMLFLAVMTLIFLYFYLTSSQQPKQLSHQTEVIHVYPVRWSCDCANFKVINGAAVSADDNQGEYIFIEPATDALKIDEDMLYQKRYGDQLQLTGQYYLDKGVPDSYERKIPEPIPKVDNARVFRYQQYKFVKNDHD
jgi:hypothetical protein